MSTSTNESIINDSITNESTTNEEFEEEFEEEFDVNYVIDENLEKSYIVRKELSEKYGKYFSCIVRDIYYGAVEELNPGYNSLEFTSEMKDNIRKVFLDKLSKKYNYEDVLVTYVDIIISYAEDTMRYDLFVDCDLSFRNLLRAFEICENILEIQKAINTIESQKERLPVAFVSVNLRKYNVKRMYQIEKNYMERSIEQLRIILQKRIPACC